MGRFSYPRAPLGRALKGFGRNGKGDAGPPGRQALRPRLSLFSPSSSTATVTWCAPSPLSGSRSGGCLERGREGSGSFSAKGRGRPGHKSKIKDAAWGLAQHTKHRRPRAPWPLGPCPRRGRESPNPQGKPRTAPPSPSPLFAGKASRGRTRPPNTTSPRPWTGCPNPAFQLLGARAHLRPRNTRRGGRLTYREET